MTGIKRPNKDQLIKRWRETSAEIDSIRAGKVLSMADKHKQIDPIVNERMSMIKVLQDLGVDVTTL
jgi:hypothetical protein